MVDERYESLCAKVFIIANPKFLSNKISCILY